MMLTTTTTTMTARPTATHARHATAARAAAVRPTTARPAMISGRVSTRDVSMRAEKFNSDDVLKTIADKWEETENKSTVITYVAGATAAVWLSSTLVGAINAVPLLPKIMELVGLGYSTWFVYRYVLFKDSRKELVEQVDALVSRVSGEE
uniref:Cyanobacterial aminoacyl-tRNA synthetase CAAD domain-containing protein n=1 Tax=Ostreococcus mediterraneus TaxID=1486918 RepID=A0A7S0T7U0_9CHLO|mmetsp:Transcript_330/g.1137  ORF Transcript_330/g.1137 Transcript_330/m.1137 type:complete len:150 (+) Transcript_330:2-451(+)